jgi:hypothetical protein
VAAQLLGGAKLINMNNPYQPSSFYEIRIKAPEPPKD